jgi:hypothetical protein
MPDLKLIGDPRRGKILKVDSGGELRECRSVAETINGQVRVGGKVLVVDPKRKSVQVGGGSADRTAALSITSTTKGLLLPRMTTVQRNAIASPTNGLLIYNSTTNKVQARAGGSWVDLH